MPSVTSTPVVTIASSPPEAVDDISDSAPSRGPLARLLVAAVRGYQLARIGRVSPCRFTPTCSQYAVEAISRHGSRNGLALAIRRLGRCRPGGPYGFDPVPEHPLSRMGDQ